MSENIVVLDFAEIKIGMEKKFTVEITESMLENFANLSGDYNPLHMNKDYAENTPFKKRVCHGMLLSSFFSIGSNSTKPTGVVIINFLLASLSQTSKDFLPLRLLKCSNICEEKTTSYFLLLIFLFKLTTSVL